MLDHFADKCVPQLIIDTVISGSGIMHGRVWAKVDITGRGWVKVDVTGCGWVDVFAQVASDITGRADWTSSRWLAVFALSGRLRAEWLQIYTDDPISEL